MQLSYIAGRTFSCGTGSGRKEQPNRRVTNMDNHIETTCKTCGRPILILQSVNKSEPIIIDGDNCFKDADGALILTRHVCESNGVLEKGLRRR